MSSLERTNLMAWIGGKLRGEGWRIDMEGSRNGGMENLRRDEDWRMGDVR